jgi:photosystem II stability/assembly factor-like uncharacterized protein
MRARTTVSLLTASFFLLFTALLLLWGSPTTRGSAEGLVWSDLGGPTGGEANVIAFNPAYPADGSVLAGGGHDYTRGVWYGDGIFRSPDGGLTWGTPGGPPRGALLAVAFSPRWQDDGFAAAGFWQGLWLTRDRGETWELVLGQVEPPSTLSAVAISSLAPGAYTILAGGPYGGFHRSTDGGKTWDSPFEPGGVSRIVFDPSAPNVALLASATGVWRSTDAGIQWTRVTTTTSVADVAADGVGHTYAIFGGQAWRSDNVGGPGAVTWQPIGGANLPRLNRLELSADGAGLFMAAGPHLYRYDLGTNALVTVTTNIPGVDIRTVAPSPRFATDQTLLVGTGDGVWISHDAGATLVRSAGFRPLRIYSIAEAFATDEAGKFPTTELFAGGEGGVYRHAATGWHPLNSGMLGAMSSLVVDLAISPAYAADQTVFAVKNESIGLGSALLRSSTRGQSWEVLPLSLEYMNQVVISPDFAHDRRIFVVGSRAIWASTDGGTNLEKLPFWDQYHRAKMLAISPSFAADKALVAVGDKVYRSSDAGATWQEAASAPVINIDGGSGWTPHRLIWSAAGRLYLTIFSHETEPPYRRHDQVWTSTDMGNSWTQLPAAPDLPIGSLATGPAAEGSGEALYASIIGSNADDDRLLAPDLYVSRDAGATWQNLGAIPQGQADLGAVYLEASATAPDQLWAGSMGVWQLDVTHAPTATPNPVHELLANRSFEYTGAWRIPDTPYDAAYSQDQFYAGYWSMRTGITDPAANIHSYSDFSQDVTLPLTGTVTLRLHRRPQAGPAAGANAGEPREAAGSGGRALAPSATLEDFYRLLEASADDLQYVLLIERPGGKIHYLYTGLSDARAWEEKTFDLTPYLGKSVRLQFGTYNNGSGPTAAQYFDVISLQAVDPTAPTPTGTPAPILTPQMWLPEIQSDPAD